MGWIVAAVVAFIIVAIIVEHPWILLIVGVIIGLFIWLTTKNGKKERNAPKRINRSYTDDTTLFLRNYLSLCQKHDARGYASIEITGKTEDGYGTKIGCTIYETSGESTTGELRSTINYWKGRLLQEITVSYDTYKSSETEFKREMQRYIGMDNLHYMFWDTDEYKFNNSGVTLSFNVKFFHAHGDWGFSLRTIRDDLLREFPTAEIKVSDGGIFVQVK